MNFLRKFMTGRYGPDQLNSALIITGLIFSLLSRFVFSVALVYVSYVFLFLAVFRLLSRNILRRRSENDKFLRYWWPIRQKFKNIFSKTKSPKTHRFFKCPSCRNVLRVPRGKGKLQITCPRCGERFIKKT